MKRSLVSREQESPGREAIVILFPLSEFCFPPRAVLVSWKIGTPSLASSKAILHHLPFPSMCVYTAPPGQGGEEIDIFPLWVKIASQERAEEGPTGRSSTLWPQDMVLKVLPSSSEDFLKEILEPPGGYRVVSIPEVTCVSGHICRLLTLQTGVHFQLAE